MLHFQLPGKPGGNLLEHLLVESIGAVRGGGIFAWANASGAYTLLEDPVMQDLLGHSDFNLIVGTDTITNLAAIGKLANIEAKWSQLTVRAFLSPTQSLFHPKLAWFEHENYVSLIVGSGNLTMGGLLSNWEAMTVTHVTGKQSNDVLQQINTFVAEHAGSLLPLSDRRILERVALNVGNERRLVSMNTSSSLPSPSVNIDSSAALVAEIPRSDNRWNQANFNQKSYETFFGAKKGTQRRIVLRHISHEGLLGDIESRPSVEVKSKNYRFELSAARGLAYPTRGEPIGTFIRTSSGQFLYMLLMPDNEGHAQMSALLTDNWTGPKREKRRVETTAKTVHKFWPESPLWNVALPEL